MSVNMIARSSLPGAAVREPVRNSSISPISASASPNQAMLSAPATVVKRASGIAAATA